ncbi:MAG: DUF2283 domain-containing protein [Cyanobacteria bacterium P01_A01_bin.135]
MKITYDPSADVLQIVLDDSEVDESGEEVEGVILDYSRDRKLVGIEILDASKRVDNPYVINYAILAAANGKTQAA